MDGKKLIFIVILLFEISESIFSQKPNFQFKDGDLLFQDLDCGELCTAIEKVTTGFKNAKLSHIGIVFKDINKKVFVIEAIGKSVHINPIDTFLIRSTDENNNPKIMVGRLKPVYSYLIKDALKKAKELVNFPYDDEFLLNNNKYYCSELIYEIFKYANGGKDFFKLKPMTFKDPATGDFFPAWIKYYENLNISIPEGEYGLNPGSISLSEKIDIIEIFGKIDGM